MRGRCTELVGNIPPTRHHKNTQPTPQCACDRNTDYQLTFEVELDSALFKSSFLIPWSTRGETRWWYNNNYLMCAMNSLDNVSKSPVDDDGRFRLFYRDSMFTKIPDSLAPPAVKIFFYVYARFTHHAPHAPLSPFTPSTMASRRSRRSRNSNTNESLANSDAAPLGDEDGDSNDPLHLMRERNRAVAEREASRLARPDQPLASRTLGHASKVSLHLFLINVHLFDFGIFYFFYHVNLFIQII